MTDYRITCDSCGGTEPVTDDETPEAVMARHWCLTPLSIAREWEAQALADGTACMACAVGVPHTCVHGRRSA